MRAARSSMVVAALLLGVLVAKSAAGCPFIHQSISSSPPSPLPVPFDNEDDPLSALNTHFRKAYAGARAAYEGRDYPFLMVSFHLELHLNATHSIRGPEPTTSAILWPLKKVCHTSLAVFSALADVLETAETSPAKLTDGARERLMAISKMIPPAAKISLPQFHAETGYGHMERQYRIMNRTLEFAQAVLKDGWVDRAKNNAFAREMGPLVMANVNDAAVDEVDRMHEVVMGWKKEVLTPDQWDALTVFIPGAHMARKGDMHKQYFQRLLEQRDPKIIYGENMFDLVQARQLMATHSLDSDAAEAFFGERDRLHRDVLADATKEYLDKKFPPSVKLV